MLQTPMKRKYTTNASIHISFNFIEIFGRLRCAIFRASFITLIYFARLMSITIYTYCGLVMVRVSLNVWKLTKTYVIEFCDKKLVVVF